MRVTGGVWGSRRLRGPSKRQLVRPTPDAMRERCFAILGESVTDARVLDLYAGTGAVGIEALSRGARSAVFVDVHRSSAAIIRANLAALGVDRERARVLQRPADRAITELVRSGARFDLIWADPPFEEWRDGLVALESAVVGGVAATGAVLCLECPSDAEVAAALPPDLAIRRDVRGGASRVVIMRAS